MINTIIDQLEKQIYSNKVLYNHTHIEIFKERFQELESLMNEILNQHVNSHNEEFIFLTFNLRELRNKKKNT
jgi:hypothetical protein